MYINIVYIEQAMASFAAAHAPLGFHTPSCEFLVLIWKCLIAVQFSFHGKMKIQAIFRAQMPCQILFPYSAPFTKTRTTADEPALPPTFCTIHLYYEQKDMSALMWRGIVSNQALCLLVWWNRRDNIVIWVSCKSIIFFLFPLLSPL